MEASQSKEEASRSEAPISIESENQWWREHWEGVVHIGLSSSSAMLHCEISW